MRTAVLVCVLTWIQGQAQATVWEFGSDTPDSHVVSHITGEITVLEKVKTIYFTVPACYSVTYVRVEVDNMLTTPAVKFNKHVNTVTISYKLLQFSKSSYQVIVKAEYNYKNCLPDTRIHNLTPEQDMTLYRSEQQFLPPGNKYPFTQNFRRKGC